jgi:hypothetical protein
MVASKFNFADRGRPGQKKEVMQKAIARRMAAGGAPNAKEQSASEMDQANQSSRNKQVGK